jgi:hypothetical protein
MIYSLSKSQGRDIISLVFVVWALCPYCSPAGVAPGRAFLFYLYAKFVGVVAQTDRAEKTDSLI